MLMTLDYYNDLDSYTRINHVSFYRSRDLTCKLNIDRHNKIINRLNSLDTFGLLYMGIYSYKEYDIDYYLEILNRIKSIPITSHCLIISLDKDNSLINNRLILFFLLDIDYIKERTISVIDIVNAYRALGIGLINNNPDIKIDIAIGRDKDGNVLSINNDIDYYSSLYYILDSARTVLDCDKYFRIINYTRKKK